MTNALRARRLEHVVPGPIIPLMVVSRSVATGSEVASNAGIRRLAVPTPFAVGEVNAYLIEDEPLTLVDCGPNSATSLRELERLLGVAGHSISDLELVVLTHQHMDHLGLAEVLAERSGAEVACLGLLAPYLRDWETYAAADDDFAHDVMLRHGLDPSAAKALRSVARMVRGWGAACHADRALADRGSLPFAGRTVRALHRPGHSPSDTVLYDESHGVLITGDHLLASVSSNALISRPLRECANGSRPLGKSADNGRPRPLLEYRASLRATRALDAEVALGGHGEPILDHRRLIDMRLRQQDERAAQLLRLLGDGPRSAHVLATSLWGDVAITQAFLTLSEVLGHLDLLIDEGRVAEDDSGPITCFEAL
jgi:glyoxylase-like metal-dependent hydrolase (beta-lactamase superfamily II)